MKKITFIAILSFTISFFGQQKPQDSLKTEDILVVKPYTPEAKNVNKIKTSAELGDESAMMRRKLDYDITDFPVASTYKPNKGKAAGIAKEKRARIFKNYLKTGYGNFNTPLVEAFVQAGDERKYNFGLKARHHSSQGGIKDLLLDDAFSDTDVSLFYNRELRYSEWNAKAGFSNNQVNFYGIDQNLTFNQNLINNTNEQQKFGKFFAQGAFSNDDSFFDGAKVHTYTFWDAFDSYEFRIIAKPRFQLPVAKDQINVVASIDYLAGSFEQGYTTISKLNYHFANVGLLPSYELIHKNLKLNLGARVYAANDLENSQSEVLIYPNVSFSTKIINELSLTAGVSGDLIQNSYQAFAEQNPFISPTQSIQATDNAYKAFVEAKGNATSNVSYVFGASFSREENKPLFKHNQIQTDANTGIPPSVESYQLGNTFSVVYDEVDIFGINGNVVADIEDVKLQAGITFNSYSTTNEAEAWNLPTLSGKIQADYLMDKWTFGAKLFLVGETKDAVFPSSSRFATPTIIKNDGYADLNLSSAYRFSERLSAFLNLQNVFNNSYERFYNYQVQPFQVLGGVIYNFDL